MKGSVMKGLWVSVCLLLLVAGGLYWITAQFAVQDHGHLIAYAVGNPAEDTLDIEIVVPYRMTRLDPPRLKPDGRVQTWKEWIGDHLQLSDETGQRVMLRNSDFADLIPKSKIGTPAFYVVGRVQANKEYTFDYYPIGVTQSKCYRHNFAPTAEGKPFERARFTVLGEP